MTSGADRILRTIASEIRARPEQVKVAIDLFDEGATVPFVARYRKEATGGLDDTQLRQLDERLAYLRELEARRDDHPRLNSRAGQTHRRARGEHRARLPPRRSSKTSICPTSRSAGPARRSRASAALDPWPSAILADRAAAPAELPRRPISDECRTSRRRSTASAIFWPRPSPRTPILSGRAGYLKTVRRLLPGSSTAKRRRARSSPTISTMASAGPIRRAIGRSPCCAAATKTC